MFASDKKVIAVKPLQALFARDPLDGLNSGVPTRTTSTLTPTTLRSVEQTFIEIPVQVEAHQNQARFVPPIIQTSNAAQQPIKTSNILNVVTKSWQGGCTRVADPGTFSVDMTASKTSPSHTRRNVGGRKPMKDKSISPEEEERRKVRRERNKQAAARCRKRRLDRTNELLMQTDDLLEQKQGLQNEIVLLQSTKEELQFLLENHPCCQLDSPRSPHEDEKPPVPLPFVVVKEEPDAHFPLDEAKTFPKPGKRPTSLPVPAFPPTSTTIDGIPISTPSTGINFNFDSLMEGGTGLTPVSGPLIPSCSVQQRNSGCGDLSSPDGPGSEKKLSQI